MEIELELFRVIHVSDTRTRSPALFDPLVMRGSYILPY
jgi:hypothetical protein